MTHTPAITAAEAFIRELRFHAEAPRPERVSIAVARLRREIEALPAELRREDT